MGQAFVGLAVLAALSIAETQATEVRTAGEMRRVMREGDLSASIDLRELASVPHLYAIGPLEGLRGEVTIWDGTPSIARVRDGAVETLSSFAFKASFLVYAEVPAWHEVPVPAEVVDARQLEAFVAQAASRNGVDPKQAFPFGLRASATRAAFHVVDKADDSPHTPEKHESVKVPFGIADTPVRLIGFYSDHHQGVFTHHDSNIHVHVITQDGRQSGHLESLELGPGAVLLLPKPGRP